MARRGDAQAPPVVLVTATGREADDLAEVLGGLLPPDRVAVFGAWETLPHERLSPRADTVGRRLAVLRRLVHPGPNDPLPTVLIAPVRSLLQPLVRGLADLQPVELTVGQVVDLEQVVRDLAGAAYTRVDLVERRGEFAVRGGLIDVFPPIEQHPLRVEFFGDEVESIRSFAVADQRTISPRGADEPAAQSGCTRRRVASSCSPTKSGRAPPSSAGSTRARRDLRAARRRPCRGGDGVARTRAGRRDGPVRRAAARGQPDPGVRPRPGAVACARPGGDIGGVPGGGLGGRVDRWQGSDRRGCGELPQLRRRARRGAGTRAGLVEHQPVRRRQRDPCRAEPLRPAYRSRGARLDRPRHEHRSRGLDRDRTARGQRLSR